MLVLHAGKRNLHKFVSQCEKVPKLRDTEFWAVRGRGYFLAGHDEGASCRASFYTKIYGQPILVIARYDKDDNLLSCFTHHPTLEKLHEFGLVQDRTSKRAISKAFEQETKRRQLS